MACGSTPRGCRPTTSTSPASSSTPQFLPAGGACHAPPHRRQTRTADRRLATSAGQSLPTLRIVGSPTSGSSPLGTTSGKRSWRTTAAGWWYRPPTSRSSSTASRKGSQTSRGSTREPGIDWWATAGTGAWRRGCCACWWRIPLRRRQRRSRPYRQHHAAPPSTSWPASSSPASRWNAGRHKHRQPVVFWQLAADVAHPTTARPVLSLRGSSCSSSGANSATTSIGSGGRYGKKSSSSSRTARMTSTSGLNTGRRR